jgi:two-component system response regulator
MRFVPTILCVDDDEDDLLFVKEAIQSQQQTFHIKEANGGQEAVNYLRECARKGELPCLVIMDINMPGMDGRQAVQKIRETEQLVEIPIAVFTTSAQASDRKFFEDQGIRFITKPFDYNVFKKKIVDVLTFCAAL